MLSYHVKAKLLGLQDVPPQGLIARGGVESIGPIPLVKKEREREKDRVSKRQKEGEREGQQRGGRKKTHLVKNAVLKEGGPVQEELHRVAHSAEGYLAHGEITLHLIDGWAVGRVVERNSQVVEEGRVRGPQPRHVLLLKIHGDLLSPPRALAHHPVLIYVCAHLHIRHQTAGGNDVDPEV